MNNNNLLGNVLMLNLSMLCISTSGALGRYLSTPPMLSIWWRAAFALVFLGLYCYWRQFRFRIDLKKYGSVFFASGLLMAVHWITYFYALQWSNVAIAMLSLFTFPIMTALLEPLLLKTTFQKYHLFLSILVLIGIGFLAPEFEFQNTMTQGLLIGLFSAFAFSLRNILLKTQVGQFNGSVLMFYNVLIAFVLLIPAVFYYQAVEVKSQLPYLFLLGLITTAIGHTLFLNSFKHFSVSTASIIGGMQPIYGILLAFFFLKEVPTWNSWIGGSLILLTVVLESWRQRSAGKP